MDRHSMTSWGLNVALAAMAAAAVLLPDAGELRKAFEFSQRDTTVQIEDSQFGHALSVEQFRGPSSKVSYVIESPPAIDCIRSYPESHDAALNRCLPQLVREILIFDNEATAQIENGKTVSPDPEIEEMRMAVTKLCRIKWSAYDGNFSSSDTPYCRAITRSVAY